MDDKKQEMKDKKQKYAYWMRPSLVDEMTEMLESANATSKSDFICQAVEFYIGYLRQQKNIDYLSPNRDWLMKLIRAGRKTLVHRTVGNFPAVFLYMMNLCYGQRAGLSSYPP